MTETGRNNVFFQIEGNYVLVLPNILKFDKWHNSSKSLACSVCFSE